MILVGILRWRENKEAIKLELALGMHWVGKVLILQLTAINTNVVLDSIELM